MKQQAKSKIAPPILLNGSDLKIYEANRIAQGSRVEIDPKAKKQVAAASYFINKASKTAAPIYGINTGFGYLANTRIAKNDEQMLQTNLLRSHASGYGTPLSLETTRLAMAIRLNVLLKGFSGVRYSLCEHICRLINQEIYPLIPEYGSVGASGDLAPLAHLALPLIGEGFVSYQGKYMNSSAALKVAGIKPFKLARKEGLGLINGTQIMLATGLIPFLEGIALLKLSDRITALTFEALAANLDPLHPHIHKVRGQKGQIESAACILNELQGSFLFDPKTKRKRVQDPYSLRCAPQVHGPARDAFDFAAKILENELNAATDNPLVFQLEQKIASGGNFHGQYLAFVFDMAAIAIAEIGSISERRLELLLNPYMSGLPAFLTPQEGLNSGYMAAQYLSASLVNENKLLSNPSCTDSIPGNVGIEDHVSMGMTSARKFRKVIENLRIILSIELLAAAQGIDLRRIKKLGTRTRALYQQIRKSVPMLKKDRMISEDIRLSEELLKNLIRKEHEEHTP